MSNYKIIYKESIAHSAINDLSLKLKERGRRLGELQKKLEHPDMVSGKFDASIAVDIMRQITSGNYSSLARECAETSSGLQALLDDPKYPVRLGKNDRAIINETIGLLDDITNFSNEALRKRSGREKK